jgi:uncharacterized cupredoxin-like copper-binding protein
VNASARLLALSIAVAVLTHPVAGKAHGDAHSKSDAPVVKEQKPWGIAADRATGLRTVRIAMSDRMRFSPESITVREGETIRFVVKNEGQVQHEFVLGTREAHEEHAALMMKFPNMEHDEPYMAHVKPGSTGEIVWTFNRSGEFGFACLIAGHYQSGMVGRVTVLPTSGKKSPV